jgi:hypothetical protein
MEETPCSRKGSLELDDAKMRVDAARGYRHWFNRKSRIGS